MNDLEKAKEILAESGATCVLCRGGTVYTSEKSGIAPMMDFLTAGIDLSEYAAADKIIGRAAAMLFVLAGVAAVYGEVASEGALSVFAAHGIPCTYGTLTAAIVNRAGDGLCPMERATDGITDPAEAFTALQKALAALRRGAPAG